MQTDDEPLIAHHPDIPAELALQGFHAVRAFAPKNEREGEGSRELFEQVLGFAPASDGWEIRGDDRGGYYVYDPAPADRPRRGPEPCTMWRGPRIPRTRRRWQRRVAEAGAHPTPVIDRFYFRSIYFREPSGVLFEIATLGPGFTVDEPLDHLGEKLSLTPQYEHLRAQIEPTLTPLRNPRDDAGRRQLDGRAGVAQHDARPARAASA